MASLKTQQTELLSTLNAQKTAIEKTFTATLDAQKAETTQLINAMNQRIDGLSSFDDRRNRFWLSKTSR